MGGKSTRSRIKDEGRKMLYDIENAMMRLKRISDLGEGSSKVINQHVAPLIALLDTTRGFVEKFFSKL